ncbi:hypothetical protein CRM22_001721 [Opisthorchis felineus]|uniref:Synaptonemal complex protein 2 Spt16M-like domain-containing protein n=1 Tax=Opisthorchis felineus TaxID=147828 RepID=A0A4S2MFV7_OPIFE|nr:hypothetical protein CRM22_001721 [Opisthorchis felineus]
MERISSLVTLFSQSSQLARHKYLMKIYQELINSGFLEPEIIRDVVSCVGGSLSGISYDELASIFDPLLRIIVFCFDYSTSRTRSMPDNILKLTLENLIETVASISTKASCAVLKQLLPKMLRICSDSSAELVGRFDILATLHVILSSIPSECRRSLWSIEDLKASINTFGTFLASMGDFDLQAHAAALLLRLVPHDCQKEFAADYIAPIPHKLSRDFSKVGGECFEKGIRTFLNELNMLNKKNPGVVSVPCSELKLCDFVLDCPPMPGDSLSTFWLDFNLESERITSYCLGQFIDGETQVSGLAVEPQREWETLVIFPELVDVLDIEPQGDLLVLKFTMLEPICDLCEWTPDIKGNTISAKINPRFVNPKFLSIRFPEEVSDEKPGGALICILKQLQNLCSLYQSSTGTQEPLVSTDTYEHFSAMAISPIAVCPWGLDECFSTPSHLNESGSSVSNLNIRGLNLVKGVIACSPVVCYMNAPSSSAHSVSSRTPSSDTSGNPPGSSGDGLRSVEVRDHHVITSNIPVPPESQDSSDLLKVSPKSNSIHSSSSNREHHTISVDDNNGIEVIGERQENIQQPGNLVEFISPMEPSPEKKREAALHSSPVIALRTAEPAITGFEFAEIPRKDARQYDIEEDVISKPVYRIHTPVAPSVMPSDGSVTKSIDSEPTVVEPSSALVPSHIQLRELIVCLDRCVLAPPSVVRTSPSTSEGIRSVQQIHTELSTSFTMANDHPPRSSVIPSPVQGSSSQLSASSDGTPMFLKTLGISSSATTIGAKPSRKLCNISHSYLVDSSPADIRCPLTPAETTVISLPALNTEVRFPRRPTSHLHTASRLRVPKLVQSLTEEASGEKALSKDCQLPASPSDKSDPDYCPLHFSPPTPTSASQKRILRSTFKRPSGNADLEKPNQSAYVESTESTPVSRLLTTASPARICGSKTPKRSAVRDSPFVHPVSSLKKRRFFISSRAERLSREQKRFEGACRVKSTISHPANEKKAKAKMIQSKRPSLSAATALAMTSQAMPNDSDPEFLPDIVDVEVIHKNLPSVTTRKHKSPEVHPVLESSKYEDTIPASWESSTSPHHEHKLTKPTARQNPRLVQLGPMLEDSVEEVDIDETVLSTPVSLFACTPPANRQKSRPNQRQVKHTESAQLKFISRAPVMKNEVTVTQPALALSPTESSKDFPRSPNPLLVSTSHLVDLDQTPADLAMQEELDNFDFNTVSFNPATFEKSPSPQLPTQMNIQIEPAQCANSNSDYVTSFSTWLRKLSLVSEKVYEGNLEHRNLGLRWSLVEKELDELKKEARYLKETYLITEISAR